MKKLFLLLSITYTLTIQSEERTSFHVEEFSDKYQAHHKPISEHLQEQAHYHQESLLHVPEIHSKLQAKAYTPDQHKGVTLHTPDLDKILLDTTSTTSVDTKQLHNDKDNETDTTLSNQLESILEGKSHITNSQKQPELSTREKAIKKALEDLPPHNRPANIDHALILVKAGDQAWSLMNQSKMYDAISKNVSTSSALHTSQDLNFFKHSFNTTDEEFWNLIQKNKPFQEKIKSKGIPFTYKDFTSENYNMIYRTMYIHEHVKSPEILKEFQQAFLKTIVQIQWKLFAETISQDGQAFTSGMITLDNPALFKLLDGYANFVFPDYRSYSGIHPKSMWADQAYTRESSHWNGQKAFNGSNFGIDIKDPQGKILPILPGNKSHLLFGLRTNGMTFVKWEEYGTTVNVASGDYSAIKHTLRYFEKKGTEDGKQQRREKVSPEVWAVFTKLHPQELSKSEKIYVESHGISAMLNILKKDNGGTSKDEQMKLFLTHTMKYDPNTLHVRKGNEVILSDSSIDL